LVSEYQYTHIIVFDIYVVLRNAKIVVPEENKVHA